jgi:hypothetical protein
MKCPRCHSDNLDSTHFFGECGAKLCLEKEIPVSQTKTLQTHVKDLIKATTFAGRHQIINEQKAVFIPKNKDRHDLLEIYNQIRGGIYER